MLYNIAMNTQAMVDFIKYNGWYPDFKRYCTTIPSVKSFRRKLYLYLVHKNMYRMFCALHKVHICSIRDAAAILRNSCYEVRNDELY